LPSSRPPTSVSLACSFSGYSELRHPHSFPTRRSSDLWPSSRPARAGAPSRAPWSTPTATRSPARTSGPPRVTGCAPSPPTATARSEEHTSELQSRENLVCRLLLEKKKTMQQTHEGQYH